MGRNPRYDILFEPVKIGPVTAPTQQIGDKCKAAAVPGKQYRTTRQLTFGFGDVPNRPAFEVELRLKYAV